MNTQTMKTLQMREAKARLAEEFGNLLKQAPENNARWEGTVTDLVEAAHITYMQGAVYDAKGRVCTFTQIVSRACSALRMPMPKNPRRTAYQARNRKGVRQEPLIKRYCRMMHEMKTERPLLTVIVNNK